MDQEKIDKEVQIRMARQTKQHLQEKEDLQEHIRQMESDLTKQQAVINKLTSDPSYFATVLRVHDLPDYSCYKVNDEVIISDEKSPHHHKTGKIVTLEPKVTVELVDQTVTTFVLEQLRLLSKPDGTYAVINIDGKPWEVRSCTAKAGDTVKIRPDTKQVLGRVDAFSAGPICRVQAVTEQWVEVEEKGEKRLVLNPKKILLEEFDRVVVDSGFFIVMEKLPRDARQRYKVASDLNVAWDDIGGLQEAKEQVREAIEYPFLYPDIFKYYGMHKPRGILLHGSQGVGKTLLAKAAATALAKLHGKQAFDTGYIYIKSPELLSKYVGDTEENIRELFERGRRHYREYSFPAILAFDEFDAIAPQRGTRRSSDVSDTIVPMFLGEMDGIDDKQTKENPIVFAMTNRPDVLDPAITRAGRISKHIKINRPDVDAALDILNIHARKVPFKDKTMLAIVCQDIFSKTKVLYRINNEHDFTLGDAVNGAMLAAIVEDAKMHALRRDMMTKSLTGVTLEDFRYAVGQVFIQQRSVNHSFDIEDFCERKCLQVNKIQIERCLGLV